MSKNEKSPQEIKKTLQKIEKILPKDASKEKICNARLKRCKKCGLKFKKGEEVCPECNTPRERCKKKALFGTNRCEKHGGRGGAKVKVDVDGIPIGYEDVKRIRSKYAIKYFEDYIDAVGTKSLMILKELEKIIHDNKLKNEDGLYDFEDLSFLEERTRKTFEALIKYGNMRSNQRIVEIESEKSNMRIGVLKDILTKRVMAMCVTFFMNALKKFVSDQELINKIIESLPQPLMDSYNRQGFYFEKSETIVKEVKPDIIEYKEKPKK